jgi:hypothetical protein
MRFGSLILLFAPLVSALTFPKSPTALQEAFVDATLWLSEEKVPGDNPAYFTRVKRIDQLFDILDFEVSPYPPVQYDT